jgi:hypothetical protein
VDGTIGQLVFEAPSRLSLTPLQELKKTGGVLVLLVWPTGVSAPHQSSLSAFDPQIQQKASGKQTFACRKPIIINVLGSLFYPADGSNMFLRKVCQTLSEYTYIASYTKSY